jgi:hypothetical protein
MPFPPVSTKTSSISKSSKGGEAGAEGSSLATHVGEFDIDKTVEFIQSLETTLNPLIHSVALLKMEKEKEEAALEGDYEALRSLETNARAEARGWKDRGRRSHVLVPPEDKEAHRFWEAAETRPSPSKGQDGPSRGLFTVSCDGCL